MRVHRVFYNSSICLSGFNRDQDYPRQPFRPHFEGNQSLARYPTEGRFRIYLHPQAWFLAQSGRRLLLQGWRAPCSGTSELLPNTSSRSVSWPPSRTSISSPSSILRTLRTITESSSADSLRRIDSGVGDSCFRRTGVSRSHDRRGRHSAAMGRGWLAAR